jgi:hypothetical protein
LLDLGDPYGGAGDVTVVFEECSVLGEYGVAFFEAAATFEDATLVVVGAGARRVVRLNASRAAPNRSGSMIGSWAAWSDQTHVTCS